MVPYLATFFFSCLLLYGVRQSPKGRFERKIIVFVALAIPCMLAALRSVEVGTDTGGYAASLFRLAQASPSITDYFSSGYRDGWDVLTPSHFEWGFSVLVWIVARLTGSFSCLLLAIEILVIFPVYVALSRFRNRVPAWVGMGIFYLMHFNVSLNMMRQEVAVAFLLLAFSFVVKREMKKCVVVFAVALLFHTSALMGLVLYALYRYAVSERMGYAGNSVRLLVLVFVALGCLVGIGLIRELLDMLGFTRYAAYLTGNLHFMPNQLILRLPIIVLFMMTWRSFSQSCRQAPFFLAILIMDLIASQLVSLEFGGTGQSFVSRVTLYFSIFYIVALPWAGQSLSDWHRRALFGMLLGAYLLLYWWYSFAYMGYNDTVPYVLGML